MQIAITPEQLANKEMSQADLNKAVEAIRYDGFIILEDTVSHEHLDILHEKMDADLETLMTAPDLPVNFTDGHLQQDPPPFAPYVFEDIVANPFVAQVTKAVLGNGVFNSYYSGNTNCPGSKMQPVHIDGGQLWRGLKLAHPAARLVVNIVLEDVTEENGSIELWPGSHLDTTVSVDDSTIKVPLQTVEERWLIAVPERGNMKKGSVLIRDIRLWHRGMPNYSDRPRQMLAMIHNIGWYQRGNPLAFNKGCEAVFEGCGFDPNVRFTDEPIDYIFRNRSYDYDEAEDSE